MITSELSCADDDDDDVLVCWWSQAMISVLVPQCWSLISPVLLGLLVFAGQPPAVDGVVRAVP